MVGGVEQAVIGTVASLGRLTDGDEHYIVLTDPSAPDWLDRYVGPNSEVVVASTPVPGGRDRAKRLLRPVLPLVRRGRSKVRATGVLPTWSVSGPDKAVEELRPDVVHFPYQWLHQTSAPSIFNPHDVQHMHHPEFFTEEQYISRVAMYKLWCESATMIEVPSRATKNDLACLLNMPEEKVLVIPRGAPTALPASEIDQGDLSEVQARYDLPPIFAFYPAQTWPHKNHIRLLEAIAALRDGHGVCLHLVCTGAQNNFWPAIQTKVRELGLDDQVCFLGFIPPEHVTALYRLALLTVFPTLFEGGGFPVLEALSEGSPLACSDLPVLVEQVSDAALLFDPESVDSIASTLLQLYRDRHLRERLRKRGEAVVGRHTWDHMARTYRALYRKLGNGALTDEDIALLALASQNARSCLAAPIGQSDQHALPDSH